MSPTPNLHLRFVEVDFWKPKSDMSFIDFVDRVLAVSSDSTIRKSDRVLNQLISIFEALLSACPVLEELTLLGCPWYARQCLTISCTTLERLTLSYEYPIVNLHSLVEAKLSLEYRGSPNEGNPMNLIEGLRNVEVLDLSSLGTSKLLSSFAELIPLFGKLSRVSIATEFQHSCTSWKFLPLLLKKSPNLKTLVIKGPLHFYDEYGEEFEPIICECLSEYSFLSSCHVKILEIIDYGGTKGELGQMKKFLEKLPYLELVNVHASAKAKLTFGTDLQVLLRACNIQLNFFFF
ncbi:unnamed protein product [Brassica oleracea]